ncbi:hypothetical protein J6590_058193 [Homalodisca vitripennis]|nr:hypothetical protein J6590_058193 [Homalodisca vitripennis]
MVGLLLTPTGTSTKCYNTESRRGQTAFPIREGEGRDVHVVTVGRAGFKARVAREVEIPQLQETQ